MAAFWLAAVAGWAEPPAESAWRIWLEPKFNHTAGAADLPGAHKTQLASGFLSPLGLESWPAADAVRLGAGDPAFAARARENASADLARLTTRYERNRQKVIEYAEVRSPDNLVASAIFAPKFLSQFEETLGPTVLLVVPNRSVAYIFPKLASHYQDYAALVLEAFRDTSWPVSLEVFELSPTGLKAIGAFSDPRD